MSQSTTLDNASENTSTTTTDHQSMKAISSLKLDGMFGWLFLFEIQ